MKKKDKNINVEITVDDELLSNSGRTASSAEAHALPPNRPANFRARAGVLFQQETIRIPRSPKSCSATCSAIFPQPRNAQPKSAIFLSSFSV